MTEVFLCRKNQLTQRGRTDLRKAGIVVVEVEDLKACQFVRAGEVLSSSDMLWATLDALCLEARYGSDGTKQREKLAANLLQLVVDSRRQESAQ